MSFEGKTGVFWVENGLGKNNARRRESTWKAEKKERGMASLGNKQYKRNRV